MRCERRADAPAVLTGVEITWHLGDVDTGAPAWQPTPGGYVLALQAWRDGAPLSDGAARLHLDPAGRPTWWVGARELAADLASLLGAARPNAPAALAFAPAGGDGFVFDPNPVVASGNRGLSSGDDVDPWRVAVGLTDLDGSGLLRGAWADVDSPAGRAFHPALQFFYSARDLHFEEVMAYHHITWAQRRLQALGFGALNARPQSVTVHATGRDASWYSPQERRIYLGDGGVDDAEDADVILHEYGHALHHAAVGALGCADARALSEGFADYLAASFTGDPCVGDWDGTFRPDGCLCDLTEVRRYPGDRTGDPHADGLLWSGLLWRLRELLGADVADRLAVGALYFQLPRSSFSDAASGLVAAACDLERALARPDIRMVVEDVLGERGFRARRGAFTLEAGGPRDGRIPLGFAFRGPGTGPSAWSDTLRVRPDGRCELIPLPAAPPPDGPRPLLAPWVAAAGSSEHAGAHERLEVAWTLCGGTLTADLRFQAHGATARHVAVTLAQDGWVALEWFGEGQQASLPGWTGWFPGGAQDPSDWVEIGRWSELTMEPGVGLGIELPPGPFALAGAKLLLSPEPAGRWTARLEALPLPAGPALDRAITICPTPARAASRAVFRTLAAGPYELDLLDASGRRVAGRALGHLDPGLHAVRLGDLDGDHPVAAGVHFVRVRGDVYNRTVRVVYLR